MSEGETEEVRSHQEKEEHNLIGEIQRARVLTMKKRIQKHTDSSGCRNVSHHLGSPGLSLLH